MTNDHYADAGYDTKRAENRRARTRAETRHDPDRNDAAPERDDSAPARRTDGGRKQRTDGGSGRRTDGGSARRSRPSDAGKKTMGDVSHTNPYTGESFGNTVAYRRGSTVVVDGGEADAVPETEEAEVASEAEKADDETSTDGETMGDISHEPPHDAPDPNAVYLRGGEGDDDVEE